MKKTIIYAAGVVAISILAVAAVLFLSKEEPISLGGEKSGQVTILDSATTTLATKSYAAREANVGEYSDCVVTAMVKNSGSMLANDRFLLKLRGSSLDDDPNLFSAVAYTYNTASSTSPTSSYNIWDYVKFTNLKTGTSYVGSAGTWLSATNTVARLAIDDDSIRYLTAEIATASTTASSTAITSVSAVVNCQK